MTPSCFRRLLWRESRGAGRRFTFFVACLAVGVAAIVSVAGLAGAVDLQVRSQARHLLAADIVVQGLRPPAAELESYLATRRDLRAARIRELATVAARPPVAGIPGRSQLVELKVVEGDYPFYGALVTEPRLPLGRLLNSRQIVAAPDLVERLDLKIGDEILIGGQPFHLSGLVLAEPDRVATPFALGPRVLMSTSGFERTDLEQLGSRIVYKVLIRLADGHPPGQLAAVATELEEQVAATGAYRVSTYLEAQEELRRALQRAAGFLGLVALLSLLLGGLGVAQTTRAWIASRMDDIAILRCLGLQPKETAALFLAQAATLGLLGSLAGLLLGVGIQALIPSLFSEIFAGARLQLWQPTALLRGLGLGLGVALLFSLRAVLAVRLVPPLRVLRRDVEPLPRQRLATISTFLLLGTGVWTAASIQGGSPARGAQFAAGIALASLLLTVAALSAIRVLTPLARRCSSVWMRHGLLALARPGAATLAAAVSLGLGVLLILALQLVKEQLSEALLGELPSAAPTAFLINIQPDQWPELASVLERHGARRIHSVPFVTARLRSVDGRQVSDLAADGGDRGQRWALTREQRLAFMEELPPDNRITAGRLWSLSDTPEVSVEEDFAEDLGATLGSLLQFDLQGVPLELQVTSLRSVEWRSFGINFFLVVEPGILGEAPLQRVATARLPPDREQRIQDLLADRFPNITLLKIREVLEKIAAVLGHLARGVRFIGAFTVISGIVILAGSISADSVRRRQHIAVLKTLGMTQGEVSALLAVEFAVVGALAGSIGAAGASLLSWAVLTRGLELTWHPRPVTLTAAVVMCLLLTVATGIAASRRALQLRPAEELRRE